MELIDIIANADTIKRELNDRATHAANEALTNMGGDRGCCGFAWVTLCPEHKGNTRAGKAERRAFERLGARKDWTGKAWQIWAPGDVRVQSIDVNEAGARAAASVLKQYGLKAYAGSRMD
jgi:hypothetical protein